MTTEISREDVLKIASDLKMEITDEQVTSVLEKYDGLLADREGDLWSEIVEELLYDIISFNDAMESCSIEKCGKNGCDCLGRLDGKEMGE